MSADAGGGELGDAAAQPGFASPQSVVTSATEANSKNKSALVVQAELLDRREAVCSGYLRKHNSQQRWQRRFFEIVGHFWVYYKTNSSDEMLCAMDLWRAGSPELTPGGGGGAAESAAGGSTEFSITWDRYRLFRAATHEEAVGWVEAIRAVQAQRPAALAAAGSGSGRGAAGDAPAFLGPGGGPLQVDGSQAQEWGERSGGGKAAGGGEGGCCAVM